MNRRIPAMIAFAASALVSVTALAHAFLERASPAVGSEVHGSPAVLTLTFTEPVEAAFSSVAVTDAAGNRMDKGAPTGGGDKHVLVVPLKPLPPGAYAIEWRVTSVDTHRTQGHFTFSVAPG